ncbi:hydrogenase maturation nickel metallochaperone HypA [Sedimentimonas flavescens]|uniref:hydrogenase maturation nickel metallochaperone HypA n=1 Tax=Sedimentimonas flavescens TaxID=2851012 RepID=UPI001C4A10F3|nr:hydrogenase maturation nickel metallochaperone HypA [Sedimentimonas flavescens]MBW0157670.1 hydrogenase maturation nickel metallochaperone HypA [Sedimentimonas flavescens]
MHEMSIAEGIRGIIEQSARQNGFDRVTRVRLEIGRFAGVETGALSFAFEVVMRGCAAEGAALEIIELPGRALCYDCGETVEIADRFDPCPNCGGGKLLARGGDEMRIKDMEVL